MRENRRQALNIERIQLLLLFGAVFSAPLFLGMATTADKYFYVYLLALLGFALPLLLRRSSFSRPTIISNLRAIEVSAIMLIFALMFISQGYGEGLIDRASSRSDATNVNLGGSWLATFLANINFLICGIAAYFLQKGIESERRGALYFGVFLAVFLLSTSGTRFLFLLAGAPLFYSFFFDNRHVRKLIIFFVLIAASSYIAVLRSGFSTSSAALIFFDLPSTASAMAVRRFDPPLSEIGNFFIGNIVVLIPRSIFPNKPLDPTVVNFSIEQLGVDAFDSGATYLPGFIGSAWLYGGWLSVFVFSIGLGYLFIRCFPNNRRFTVAGRAFASLTFIGLLLQFRNISVFYFLPALYLLITSTASSTIARFVRTFLHRKPRRRAVDKCGLILQARHHL